MRRRRSTSTSTGFTLVEMIVTLAIVGLVAMVALPLYEVTATRTKEAELRQALRTIRTGLDAYKAAVDAGLLPRNAGESGFPPNLDVLTQPLDTVASRDLSSNGNPAVQRLVILRQLPRDPFFPDLQVPAAQTWSTRAYGSRSDDPQPGADVFDVSSTSTHVGLDGTAYNTW
jgi:general secretion pathway protein G